MESCASVARIQSGREWVDVLVHDSGALYLVGHNLGPSCDDGEAREFVDELRSGPRYVGTGLDEAGPWVDRLLNPIR